MKVNVSFWVYATQYDWQHTPKWNVSGCDPRPYDKNVIYADHRSMDMDVPDSLNITTGRIQTLNAQAAELRAQFTRRINEINEQIKKLEALEAPKECAND